MRRVAKRAWSMLTPIRVWHWLNAVGIAILCLTGLQIRFPDYVAIFSSYRSAIDWHEFAGIALSAAYAIWCISFLVLRKNPPRMEQRGHSFFVGQPEMSWPQKIVYFVIMFAFFPAVVVTGICLLNISPLRQFIEMAGGIRFLIGTHFLAGCCFCSLLLIHIYLAAAGRDRARAGN